MQKPIAQVHVLFEVLFLHQADRENKANSAKCSHFPVITNPLTPVDEKKMNNNHW